MAHIDQVEIANDNLIRVREKLDAAKVRRNKIDKILSDLIVRDGSDQDVNRAKADLIAASTDLETLISAVAEAERRLEKAQQEQELAGTRGAADRIE